MSAPTDNNAPVPVSELQIYKITIKRRFDQPSERSSLERMEDVSLGDHLWQIGVLENLPIKASNFTSETIERKFKILAEKWQRETAVLSIISQKVLHPAYQQIIGMGSDALPLLLRELERSPNHWFWALKAITGANPIHPRNRGRLKLMAQDWLEWGRDHGYEW